MGLIPGTSVKLGLLLRTKVLNRTLFITFEFNLSLGTTIIFGLLVHCHSNLFLSSEVHQVYNATGISSRQPPADRHSVASFITESIFSNFLLCFQFHGDPWVE